MSENTKRLAIDITEEQKAKLERYFKWGDLSPFLRMIIDDILILLDEPKNARLIIGAYARRKIGLNDISPSLFGEVDDGQQDSK